jgi:hypothetical protein
MVDDNFARRAGEIIASAVRTASAPFDRGGKRKSRISITTNENENPARVRKGGVSATLRMNVLAV